MKANARCSSFQTMKLYLGLVGCICQYRYIIGVVGVGNCFFFYIFCFLTNKNFRFSRRYILEIYNPKLIELILNPVLIPWNIFCYWCYLLKQFLKNKRCTVHWYGRTFLHKKKLHYFCNTSPPLMMTHNWAESSWEINYSSSLCCAISTAMKVKWATLVEGDQKVPFSIATIPRYRGGCYSFPCIAPL